MTTVAWLGRPTQFPYPLDVVRVGPYVVERELGAGGMGVVYLARRSDGTPVAIKTMAARSFSDGKDRAQFVREARIAQRVRHPNVVAMIDLLEEDGHVCHVMEYVDGLSVHALLRDAEGRGERIPARVALRLLADVLHGIGAAYHATKDDGTPLWIVHRDVSPQNLIVGVGDGMTRVLDFGIAKTATYQTATAEQGFRGKVRYVAPEQVKGMPVSHKSDIYSAGVVAWEMLAGRDLFKGETVAIIATRVLLGAVPELSALNEEVDAKLDAFVRAMLARELEDRPGDARALAAEIESSFPIASHAEVAAYVAAAKARRDGAGDALGLPATLNAPALAPTVRMDLAVVAQPAPTVPPPPETNTQARASRRVLPFVLGVLALLVLAGVVLSMTRGAAAPRTETPKAAPSAPPASTESAAATSAVVATPPTAEGSVPSRVVVTRTKPRVTAAPSVHRTTGPDCRTPTYLDERGIQRIRPECLKP